MILNRSNDGKKEGLELAGTLPEGAEVIGTIERSIADKGALVKLKSGMVVQLNNGVLRNIPFTDLQFSLK